MERVVNFYRDKKKRDRGTGSRFVRNQSQLRSYRSRAERMIIYVDEKNDRFTQRTERIENRVES